jgi:hypothetical protein
MNSAPLLKFSLFFPSLSNPRLIHIPSIFERSKYVPSIDILKLEDKRIQFYRSIKTDLKDITSENIVATLVSVIEFVEKHIDESPGSIKEDIVLWLIKELVDLTISDEKEKGQILSFIDRYGKTIIDHIIKASNDFFSINRKGWCSKISNYLR